MREAVAFVCDGQPPTANKKLRPDGRDFLDRLRAAAMAAGLAPAEGLLCGVVYWFTRRYRPHHDPDADNLSKKVWDGLIGLGFADDPQVRLRLATVVDLEGSAPAAMEILDLTAAPPALLDALDRLLAAPQDGPFAFAPGVTYVEVGRFAPGMIRFRLAGPDPGQGEPA